MKTTTPLLLLSAGLLACSSGPQSTLGIEILGLDGTTQSVRTTSTVSWSGGGEQVIAQLPGGTRTADEGLTLPLRIGRIGPYVAESPVTVRAFGRAWVSEVSSPPEVLIDRLWYTGDPDFPWRHFGTLAFEDPRPVDHSLDVLEVSAEFSIAGPNCTLANEGESRCGVAWPFAPTADLAITQVDNDCPAYVVETWIEDPTAAAGPFQIDIGGFKRISCQDAGNGRRLCGSHEDEMEVGSCMWNASISLFRPDELRVDGVARCGESGAVQTCTAHFRLSE